MIKIVCELILLLYIKGVLEELWLVGVFHITFTIDDLEGERIYIVSLNISICFDDHTDCYMSAQILKHTRLPKELCKYDTQYSIRGKYPILYLSNKNVDIYFSAHNTFLE